MKEEIVAFTDSVIRLGNEFGLSILLPLIVLGVVTYLGSLWMKNRYCPHCGKPTRKS